MPGALVAPGGQANTAATASGKSAHKRMNRRKYKSNLKLLVHHPLVFARFYRWSLLFLFIGAALDAITTAVLSYRFGPEGELHPVVRLMTYIFGPIGGAVIGKIGQVIFAIFVASLWRPWCRWILLLCGLLYLLAAVSNHFMLI